MKVLLLCAGYGTRFVRDIEADPSHSHLVGVPKPLLPVGGKPLISHWTEVVKEEKKRFSRVCVVHNDKYKTQFADWLANEQDGQEGFITLVNDGSTDNASRLGAVACIQLAVAESLMCDEPILVIAGDTLFKEDFSLNEFVQRFEDINKRTDPDASLIVECPCSEAEVSKRGIIETDSEGKVTSFLEKPKPDETKSRKQCPCFYLLHQSHLRLIGDFLDAKKDAPLEERDASGNFLRYLIEHASVYSHPVTGRFDVGGLQSYVECCQSFEKL